MKIAKVRSEMVDDHSPPIERSERRARPSRGPFRAPQPHLRWLESTLERALGLEHGANIFPLLHILLYYTLLLILVFGLVASPWLVAPIWLLTVLGNYSLTIGVLHMHSHRKLFVWRPGNRVTEFLLCLPCGLSYPIMKYIHVHLHHRYSDGEGDPTSTKGYRSGWRAVWYWLRYPVVCHLHTAAGLFARDAVPGWRRLRVQYILDTSAVIAVAIVYGYFDLKGMLLIYVLPMVIVSVNIGYFAWLTHAPADDGPINGSINTTSNLMNLLIHNQGHHAPHHRYPGLHWTQLPDHLDMMKGVNDELIVPYWVTLDSALRILKPRSFRDANYGRKWKERYTRSVAKGNNRLSCLPYFGWVRR